ncbi:MAG: AbrB family transcriptional regulator [Paracoccus sp. (in: a-proteobacteria)]|uniref:AbrB family transcriptional regulator n=1 Tax=Paracoccus sp. TaxID=267 RepID=UPI00391DAA6E
MTGILRVALALAIGAAGGALFAALGLPLPWMLGALFATMTAAVSGAPVTGPARLRPVVVAVIGVLLGARFTPDVLAQAGAWLGSVAILMAYVVVVALVVVPFYRFAGRFDWVTAYFAGMPGGLTEMIEIGEASGAKPAPIILAHSLRIVVTIALIALWFRVIQGESIGAATGGPQVPLTWTDAAVMLGCAVLGSVLGKRLRFPAPTFLGPLVLSALLHLGGATDSVPPALLVTVAQVVLGTVLGCRFQGIRAATLLPATALSIGATLLSLALALGAGLAMQSLLGISTEQALLALAPGGLTEMGLIALAIQADVAFVALHHVIRILFVILLAPLAFRLLRIRRDPARTR